jgi:hypothetical protein
MTDRDMRPNRFDLTLQYAREFVAEWFDQNPLGQIGIIGMRAGLGEKVIEMSGWSVIFHSYLSLSNPSKGIPRRSSECCLTDENLSPMANLVCKTPLKWHVVPWGKFAMI